MELAVGLYYYADGNPTVVTDSGRAFRVQNAEAMESLGYGPSSRDAQPVLFVSRGVEPNLPGAPDAPCWLAPLRHVQFKLGCEPLDNPRVWREYAIRTGTWTEIVYAAEDRETLAAKMKIPVANIREIAHAKMFVVAEEDWRAYAMADFKDDAISAVGAVSSCGDNLYRARCAEVVADVIKLEEGPAHANNRNDGGKIRDERHADNQHAAG